MCDPLTVGGLVLSAGSMALQQRAQSKVQSARKGAMAAERLRQSKLDQEADALNAASQDRYRDFQGQQEDKANSLGKFFTDQNEGLPTGSDSAGIPTEVLPGSSNNIVVNEQNRQKAKAKQFSDQQGEALGNLRAFGDLLGGIGRLQARDASRVGQVGGFKRGSSAILPYELEAANSKGDGLSNLATIVGGIGKVGLAAGLSGASDGLFGITNADMVGPQLPGTDPTAVVRGSGSFGNIAARNGLRWGF